MKKVAIENYRGFEIYFAVDDENFEYSSEQWEYRAKRKSLSSCRKYIDEFLKDNENQGFRPFFIQEACRYEPLGEKLRVIGLRKDRQFQAEDMAGNKVNLSSYRENHDEYILYDERNEAISAEIGRLDDEKAELTARQRELAGTFHKKSLRQIREERGYTK